MANLLWNRSLEFPGSTQDSLGAAKAFFWMDFGGPFFVPKTTSNKTWWSPRKKGNFTKKLSQLPGHCSWEAFFSEYGSLTSNPEQRAPKINGNSIRDKTETLWHFVANDWPTTSWLFFPQYTATGCEGAMGCVPTQLLHVGWIHICIYIYSRKSAFLP